MEKLILLIALLLYAPLAWATSGDVIATFGDKNSSNVHRIEGDNNGVVTFAQDTGIKYPYLGAKTTTYTLTAAQTGTTVVYTGTVSGAQFNLPAAALGLRYTIVGDVAKWFYVAPNGTDIIKLSTNGAGGRVANIATAAVGDSITVSCVVAGTWSISNRVGTWAPAP